MEDLYCRYARWEKYLRNESPLARVGLVYSQQTAWFHGGNVEDHTLGWYQALIEARIPFDMVHDRLLDAAHAIGAELTDAFQIVPEQSTAAIAMHHPQATYFNAGALRELTPA